MIVDVVREYNWPEPTVWRLTNSRFPTISVVTPFGFWDNNTAGAALDRIERHWGVKRVNVRFRHPPLREKT